MKNNLLNQTLALITISLMIGVISISAINAEIIENKLGIDLLSDNKIVQKLDEGFTNITVYEAWDFLTNTGNGIQIPIDVRYDDEWVTEHIDTPSPENPKHYSIEWLLNETKLLEFMQLYDGKEIILYCQAGCRSLLAAQTLANNGFNGTIYNMLGGIGAWKNAGYPTIWNRAPEIPVITGPTKGKVGVNYPYTLLTTDPDGDDVYYNVSWGCCGNETHFYGPFPSGEEVIINHTYKKKGTFIIKAKASDRYGNESDWATYEVNMPKSKIAASIFFQRLVQNHPFMYAILKLFL
jgi:rhodanese-related sulfurtransferase